MNVDRVLGVGSRLFWRIPTGTPPGSLGWEHPNPRCRVLAASHRPDDGRVWALSLILRPTPDAPKAGRGRAGGIRISLFTLVSMGCRWSLSGICFPRSGCCWFSFAGWRDAPGFERVDRGAGGGNFGSCSGSCSRFPSGGRDPVAQGLVRSNRIKGVTLDTISAPVSRFCHRADARESAGCFFRGFHRHRDRRSARPGPHGHHRAASADHHRHGHGYRPDLDGRDLLRSDVRRIDHLHPRQHPGRSRLRRHLHRRLPDGPPGAGGPGARDVPPSDRSSAAPWACSRSCSSPLFWRRRP